MIAVLMVLVLGVIVLGWFLAGVAFLATLATLLSRMSVRSSSCDEDFARLENGWQVSDAEFLREAGIEPWQGK
ncbi:MAG TPA: hypothetical protein VLY24_15220 [Bryobacteraceae bacterium]|nr:hypothetical protein [Bryobacteraceae bacterium]